MPLPSGPAIVLGKVKSGAAWPTFRFVCGAAGRCTAGLGLGVGVCADAIEAAANMQPDPAANRDKMLRAFLIMLLTPLPDPSSRVLTSNLSRESLPWSAISDNGTALR